MSFIYYGKPGISHVFTPETLQQMCEIENVVFGSKDYGKVCLNSADAPVRTGDHAAVHAHAGDHVCARL